MAISNSYVKLPVGSHGIDGFHGWKIIASLRSNDFELPWLQPGILLCMLCILLWFLGDQSQMVEIIDVLFPLVG